MSVRESGKLLLLNLEINNKMNQSITRFEIIWQQ